MVQQTQSETANQVFGAVGTRLTGGSVASASQGMSSGDNIFERQPFGFRACLISQNWMIHQKLKALTARLTAQRLVLKNSLTALVKAGVGYAYSKTDIDGFMRDTDVKNSYGYCIRPNTNQATGMSTVLQPTAGLIMKKRRVLPALALRLTMTSRHSVCRL